ncbi:hypothetical protein HK102_001767 [Quaeritorhiza haematococci]|nr:hypothetical protein HK102_001767 [Quaeritorhiza haematococci]
MTFTATQLSHPNPEVREAAVKVVVEVALIVPESNIEPFFKDIRPQLLQIIKEKIADARGKDFKTTEIDESDKLTEVRKLQEQLKEIKELVKSPESKSAIIDTDATTGLNAKDPGKFVENDGAKNKHSRSSTKNVTFVLDTKDKQQAEAEMCV